MELPGLAFPAYNFKIQTGMPDGQSSKIFDIVRKKYVALTPEEWVRQHLLHFLVEEKQIPLPWISVEKKIRVNQLFKRTDVVIYSRTLKPLLIAECKAPGVTVSQAAFDQAARYNLSLGVTYFIVTNGIDNYCCRADHSSKSYLFLKEIPGYEQLLNEEPLNTAASGRNKITDQ